MSLPSPPEREKAHLDAAAEPYERGLASLTRGEHFAAHEALEEAWRAAARDERDFFQGLVHVAAAWYQAGRGNRVGCERQLGKATRRLSPFSPVHRQLDVAGLLAQVAMAGTVYPDLPPVEIRRLPGTG